MRHPDRNDVSHKMQPPRRIPWEPLDESHKSSSDETANFFQHLRARDSLHASRTHFITPTNRFGRPKSFNFSWLIGGKALNQLLGQRDLRVGGEFQRGICDLIQG